MLNEGFGSRFDACSLRIRVREECNRVARDLSFVDLVLEIRKGKRKFVQREELREHQCVCVCLCAYVCVCDLCATRWPNVALVRYSGRYSKR